MIDGLPDGVTCRVDEPMSRHTPLRVGGVAALWVVVHAPEALEPAVAAVGKAGGSWQPWGAGTRTLVREAGVAGALLRLGAGFGGVEVHDDLLVAGGAVPVPALLAIAAAAGLAPPEALARTPGSWGAALRLDEGAWNEQIVEVRYLGRGRVRVGGLPEARQKGALMLGASLRLPRVGVEAATQALARAIAGGKGRGPTPFAWWAPPKRGGWRARFQRSGLGGVRLRSVLIPEEQPETFVNLGGGTAADVALLERTVQDRIQRDTGEEPTARVRWIGRQGRG